MNGGQELTDRTAFVPCVCVCCNRYQTYYEQQHVKQIILRQHRGIYHIATKTKIMGYIETFLIILCSVLQYVFVRRLFKNKKLMSVLGV